MIFLPYYTSKTRLLKPSKICLKFQDKYENLHLLFTIFIPYYTSKPHLVKLSKIWFKISKSIFSNKCEIFHHLSLIDFSFSVIAQISYLSSWQIFLNTSLSSFRKKNKFFSVNSHYSETSLAILKIWFKISKPIFSTKYEIFHLLLLVWLFFWSSLSLKLLPGLSRRKNNVKSQVVGFGQNSESAVDKRDSAMIHEMRD